VFLDANILIAAAIEPEGGSSMICGLPGVVLVTNEQAAKEAWDNLVSARARWDPARCRERLLALLSTMEVHASGVDRSSFLFCPWALSDPDDVPILMSAIGTACRYLVTSDVACFGRYYGQTLEGVTVLSVSKFLRLMRRAEGTG
jgi:predicted nucleic acid-binding protein